MKGTEIGAASASFLCAWRFWIVLSVALLATCARGSADEETSCLPPACTVRGGIPNVLAKLERGEPVRIAYVGGSITAAEGWRPMTLAWFRQQYPEARVEEINAAIQGTGSKLAVFRLEHEVLRHDPDLVFVEFAVNDGGSQEEIERWMEGLVRKARRASPDLDMCLVYTVGDWMLDGLRRGDLPISVRAHERVAQHYGIPSIQLGTDVVRRLDKGELIFTGPRSGGDTGDKALVFAYDSCHPSPAGHRLYADTIARSIETMAGVGEAGLHPLPPPLHANNSEYASPIPPRSVRMSGGWHRADPATDPVAKEFAGRFQEIWVSDAPGETVSFRFSGDTLMLYDIMGPGVGSYAVSLNDSEPRVVSRADTWRHEYYVTLADDLSADVHTVTLETLSPDPQSDTTANSDHATWYLGWILLTGRLVEADECRN